MKMSEAQHVMAHVSGRYVTWTGCRDVDSFIRTVKKKQLKASSSDRQIIVLFEEIWSLHLMAMSEFWSEDGTAVYIWRFNSAVIRLA